MHSILARQVRRHGIDVEAAPVGWQSFIRAVNGAYCDFERDRELLERSLELTSREMMHANTELREHRAHLEELVRKRTAQLEIAKERAEAASHAKTTFLTKMSHELRTPLNAILGYAQLFLQGEQDENARKGLKIIRQSGEHLLRLINDVLSLSRIEAGETRISNGPVDLGNVLERLLQETTKKAELKKLRVTFEQTGVMPCCMVGDESLLHQVLANLLDNAVKFTTAGQVVLRVMRRECTDKAVRVRFEVEDTGCGITPALMPQLFQPFEQVGHAEWGEGTGLGLAISRKLVRLMGGDLFVNSEPGKGSLFYFDLPFELPASRTDASFPKTMRHVGGSLNPLRGKERARQAEEAPEILPARLEEAHLPPREIMQELLHLARMGDLSAIEEQARALKQDEAMNPLADQLCEWAWAFEDEKIIIHLQTLIGETGV